MLDFTSYITPPTETTVLLKGENQVQLMGAIYLLNFSCYVYITSTYTSGTLHKNNITTTSQAYPELSYNSYPTAVIAIPCTEWRSLLADLTVYMKMCRWTQVQCSSCTQVFIKPAVHYHIVSTCIPTYNTAANCDTKQYSHTISKLGVSKLF